MSQIRFQRARKILDKRISWLSSHTLVKIQLDTRSKTISKSKLQFNIGVV